MKIYQGGERGMLLGGGSHKFLKLVQKYFFKIVENKIKRNLLSKAP